MKTFPWREHCCIYYIWQMSRKGWCRLHDIDVGQSLYDGYPFVNASDMDFFSPIQSCPIFRECYISSCTTYGKVFQKWFVLASFLELRESDWPKVPQLGLCLKEAEKVLTDFDGNKNIGEELCR